MCLLCFLFLFYYYTPTTTPTPTPTPYYKLLILLTTTPTPTASTSATTSSLGMLLGGGLCRGLPGRFGGFSPEPSGAEELQDERQQVRSAGGMASHPVLFLLGPPTFLQLQYSHMRGPTLDFLGKTTAYDLK